MRETGVTGGPTRAVGVGTVRNSHVYDNANLHDPHGVFVHAVLSVATFAHNTATIAWSSRQDGAHTLPAIQDTSERTPRPRTEAPLTLPQAEIQRELERREWAEPDDNVMAEYITVLLANGSSQERVQTEMDDLVGSDFGEDHFLNCQSPKLIFQTLNSWIGSSALLLTLLHQHNPSLRALLHLLGLRTIHPSGVRVFWTRL